MLTEIIIYIALFSFLFSSSFAAAFQTIDAIRYLDSQKEVLDNLYFFSARLDNLVQSSLDWKAISAQTVADLVPGSGLTITSFSSQIIESATSSNRVLLLKMQINKKLYTFSYVQEK